MTTQHGASKTESQCRICAGAHLEPLLSLGYMVATHAALLGAPVHPGQFCEPLRTDARRRRALLILCATYGLLALAVEEEPLR